MRTLLITGGNRGIGLELVRQYLEQGERVYATCRDPAGAGALNALAAAYPGRLELRSLELTDGSAIEQLAAALRTELTALDLLICNAGVLTRGEQLGHLDARILADTFAINASAPILLCQALLPLLERSQRRPAVVHISSELGSIARRDGSENYSYGASKAALNMLMRLSSFDLQARGVLTAAVSPGWVRTDMGGPGAALEVRDSVAAVRQFIAALGPGRHGGLFNRFGDPVPW